MAPSKKLSQEDEAKKELVMVEHQLAWPKLFEHLNLGANFDIKKGLTDAQHAQIKEKNGPNLLTPPPTEPEWKKFLKELFSFFACLLWIGSILCFVGYALRADQENLYLGIVLAFVVTVTAIFGYFQNSKASKLMDSFKGMMPEMVTCVRNGKDLNIDASDLVVGDIVKMKAGDKVAADIRVIECTDDAKVDNASLTGESEPQKRTNEFTNENPLETRNLCFFGTLIPSGKIEGMVVNTGDGTVMGRIATLATVTDSTQSPISMEIEHFVHVVSAIAIFLGVAFFIIIMASPNPDPIGALVFMIGIIVANVPEGLLATVTVCLTLTAKRMATKMILVKNLEGVETLGSTTCICSDKTGTLTQNIMTVAEMVYSADAQGAKEYNTPCSLTPEGNYDEKNGSYLKLRKCATLCNNAVFDEDSKYENETKKDKDGSVKKTVHKDRPIKFRGLKTMGDGSQMEVVQWETIGDASESAMIKFTNIELDANGTDLAEFRAKSAKVCEVPFNSKNKYQLSVHVENGKYTVYMKGAPERIIGRCDRILENGEVVAMTPKKQKEVEDTQLSMSKKGLRILGFCYCPVTKPPTKWSVDDPTCNFPIGNNPDPNHQCHFQYPPGYSGDKADQGQMIFLGLMALIDPPRPQVPGAVALCKTAGIKVIMVTGDHPITAKAIAYKVGILWSDTKEDIEEKNDAGEPYRNPAEAQAIVVAGWDISVDTSTQEWNKILAHPQCVFARTSPQQKLIIVENCQAQGQVVAVTGDGVNDSPALKKADIGVAMGIMGSAVSKEAADMILLDDNFASIVNGVEEGRLIFDNLKKSIAYTLSSNIPEISPFLVHVVAGVPMPLTTVLILCVDLGTDMVPAISMAYEQAESDIMLRKPRNGKVDRLVTKKLVAFAYLQIGVIQAASGFYTWMVVLNDYGYGPAHLPGNGANLIWGKQAMYAQLKGGAFCNSGLDYDKRCIISPGSDCRVVGPDFNLLTNGKFENRPLNKFTNPYGETDPANMKVCDVSNNMGYFAMPVGMKDGVFNCNPEMTKAEYDAFAGNKMPMAWYKRNCKGYRWNMPIAWKGPYPLWANGVTLRGDVVDMRHALKNADTGGSRPTGFPKYVRQTTEYDNGDTKTNDKATGLTRTYGYQSGFQSTSAQAHASAIAAGYIVYNPYSSRMSPFYKQSYFWWDMSRSDDDQTATGLGADGSNPLMFYQFQTSVNRFIINDQKAYAEAAGKPMLLEKSAIPTSGSAVNFVTMSNGEFNHQCQYTVGADGKGKDTCTKKKASFSGNNAEANYFVKTCAVDKLPSTTTADAADCDRSGQAAYAPGDCVLNGSPDKTNCDGTNFNLDLYVKESNGQYTTHKKGCVKGNNLNWMSNSDTVASCQAKCDADDKCKAIEFGVAYGGPGKGTKSNGDCTADTTTGTQTIERYNWKSVKWYGSVGESGFREAYVSNAVTANDNGGCGETNYIGEGHMIKDADGKMTANPNGGVAINGGYETFYKYPFIATFGNDKEGDGANEDLFNGSTDGLVDGTNRKANVAQNVFSRMSQKQALHHAQGAFWMCIVVVQWADLLICKTRWLSIVDQGMSNDTMNFGLFFETLLAAWLAYFSSFCLAFGTRNIRVTHWFPAMPFSMLIFGYDETRKFMMRATSPVKIDKKTGQSVRVQGWLERNTYY